MFFMSRFNAAAPKASRNIAEGRSPRRRRAPLCLETLEARDLKTGIAGVTFQYGMISIQGPNAAGNSVQVDRIDDSVRVTVNGQEARFHASEVSSIAYTGGASGWDRFENNTGLYSQMYAFGGYNNFSGGSYYNYVVLRGNNNSYDSRGGAGLVYSYDGTNDSISHNGNNYVYSYDTSSYYSFFF